MIEIIVGSLIGLVCLKFQDSPNLDVVLNFSTDTFLLYILPPIIFAEGTATSTSFRTVFQHLLAPPHPARAVCRVLLGAQTYHMPIGARNPMFCPIWGFRHRCRPRTAPGPRRRRRPPEGSRALVFQLVITTAEASLAGTYNTYLLQK